MSTPVVRAGTLDDAPAIARLINAVIAEGAPVLLTGAFGAEEERAFLAALAPRGGYHVAEAADGEIVAAQVFAPHAAEMPAHDHVAVMGTWVAAPWRRRGVGRALCARTFAAARERGFTKLFTDVRADNVESLAFHLAQGFSIAGAARDQAIVGGRSFDVVFIERGL